MISLALVFFLANSAHAQVDTTAKKDTLPPPPNTTAAPASTTTEPQPTPKDSLSTQAQTSARLG